MGLQDLFGSTLTGKDGSTVDVATLKGKVVGIYFSAHWCPPCRGFTPVLAEKYKALKEAGKDFEIVFASSDKDAKQFEEYFGEMPWLALPYEDRARKEELSKKFKVRGIPTFVIVDGEGNTITKDGRSAVMSDEYIENFPWTPPTLEESLGNTFINNKGDEVSLKSITDAGKNIGIYFSAHWCPPCKGFTPKLAAVYEKLQAAGKPFEVIFASSDRGEDEFKSYFSEMPWLALPFADRKRKEQLSTYFEVQGIPTFVMLGPDLKVINKAARNLVDNDSEGKNFPWAPPLIVDLEECSGLNDEPCVVLMMEDAEDHWDVMDAALTNIAKVTTSSHPHSATHPGTGLHSKDRISQRNSNQLKVQ